MTQDNTQQGAPHTANHTGNILLVDDDKFLLDMYSMKFVQEGYNVQACMSGNDALGALKGGFAPDAILFDLTMPECDGYEFLAQVNAAHYAPKALKVALTNQSTEEEKKRIMDAGADQFVVKATMIPSEVVNIINTALSTRKAA